MLDSTITLCQSRPKPYARVDFIPESGTLDLASELLPTFLSLSLSLSVWETGRGGGGEQFPAKATQTLSIQYSFITSILLCANCNGMSYNEWPDRPERLLFLASTLFFLATFLSSIVSGRTEQEVRDRKQETGNRKQETGNRTGRKTSRKDTNWG